MRPKSLAIFGFPYSSNKDGDTKWPFQLFKFRDPLIPPGCGILLFLTAKSCLSQLDDNDNKQQ